MILVAISCYGRGGKHWDGAKPPKNFETTLFHGSEMPLLVRERELQKGTFILLLKRQGSRSPRTPPLVAHLSRIVRPDLDTLIPSHGLHVSFLIRNHFISSLVLDSQKFKKLLELQGKS